MDPYGLKIAAAKRFSGGGSGAPPMGQPATQSSTVQGPGGYGALGSYGGQVPDAGAFQGPGMGVRKQLKRMFAQNAIYGNQGLIGSLNQLGGEANQDWTQMYAQQAAPQFERLHDYQNQAVGNLTRDLASRGLDDPDGSTMQAGLGALYGQGAAARSGLANTAQQQALNRHDSLQGEYQQALFNLVNGGGRSAVDIQNQLSQERLQQEQIDAASDPFSQILGSLGGLAGTYLGGGFNQRPQAPRTPAYLDPSRNYGY